MRNNEADRSRNGVYETNRNNNDIPEARRQQKYKKVVAEK